MLQISAEGITTVNIRGIDGTLNSELLQDFTPALKEIFSRQQSPRSVHEGSGCPVKCGHSVSWLQRAIPFMVPVSGKLEQKLLKNWSKVYSVLFRASQLGKSANLLGPTPTHMRAIYEKTLRINFPLPA